MSAVRNTLVIIFILPLYLFLLNHRNTSKFNNNDTTIENLRKHDNENSDTLPFLFKNEERRSLDIKKQAQEFSSNTISNMEKNQAFDININIKIDTSKAETISVGDKMSANDMINFAVTKSEKKQKEESLSSKEKKSGFEKSTKKLFDLAFAEEFPSCTRTPYPKNLTQCPPKEKRAISFDQTKSCYPRYPLYQCDHSEFKGGLQPSDRVLLGKLYYHANSVLEFGIGESTTIAAHTNIPRYVGVESSLEWIGQTRDKVPSRFTFHFADNGKIIKFGFAKYKLPKNAFNYQVSLLASHPKPFDVYFIDGRYRTACAVMSFLHALHYCEDKKVVYEKTIVAVHDYRIFKRRKYERLEKIANVVRKSRRIAVFQLKAEISEEDLYQFWDDRAINQDFM